jgi:hypothetical protein
VAVVLASAICGLRWPTCSAGSPPDRVISKILDDFPELTEQDIRAWLAYAADGERRLITAAT